MMRLLQASQGGLALGTKANHLVLTRPRCECRYRLQSELAHAAIHAADRDPNQKLSWVNSISALFLVVGLAGYKPVPSALRPVPPFEEAGAAIVEPLPPPPTQAEQSKEEQSDEDTPDTSRVVVVTPAAPNINFAVPTIGNLVVPTAAAKAPPLAALRPVAPLRNEPAVLETTGNGGERPQPPYPKAAIEQGQQGSVMLRLTVDDAGLVKGIEIARSSGSALLDRSAVEFVKRRWALPSGSGAHIYQATITYKLQME